MKCRLFVLFIIGLSVSACQQHLAIKEQEATTARKRIEAAKSYTQLGVGYIKQQDYPRAKRKLLRALKFAPHDADANAAMAYLLEKTDHIAEAKMYYEKALSLNPDSGTQKNNYGAFLCRLGQYQQGLKLLLQAGENVNYVNSAMAYENAGFCAELMQNDKLSQDCFKKALRQDPDRKTALYELTQLLMKHQEIDATLKLLKQYAKLTLQEPLLLRMGIIVAKKSGQVALAHNYEQQLQALTQTIQQKEAV